MPLIRYIDHATTWHMLFPLNGEEIRVDTEGAKERTVFDAAWCQAVVATFDAVMEYRSSAGMPPQSCPVSIEHTIERHLGGKMLPNGRFPERAANLLSLHFNDGADGRPAGVWGAIEWRGGEARGFPALSPTTVRGYRTGTRTFDGEFVAFVGVVQSPALEQIGSLTDCYPAATWPVKWGESYTEAVEEETVEPTPNAYLTTLRSACDSMWMRSRAADAADTGGTMDETEDATAADLAAIKAQLEDHAAKLSTCLERLAALEATKAEDDDAPADGAEERTSDAEPVPATAPAPVATPSTEQRSFAAIQAERSKACIAKVQVLVMRGHNGKSLPVTRMEEAHKRLMAGQPVDDMLVSDALLGFGGSAGADAPKIERTAQPETRAAVYERAQKAHPGDASKAHTFYMAEAARLRGAGLLIEEG